MLNGNSNYYNIQKETAMKNATDFYSLEDLNQFETIANQKPAEKLSDRYGFVPTIDVATALYDQGWVAREVREQTVRNLELKGTQKHMIRFAMTDDLVYRFPAQTGRWIRNMKRCGISPELVFFGSHDGSTRFKMFLGFLRVVCFNEMVTGDMLEEFCFVHRSQARVKADQTINAVGNAIPLLGNDMRKLMLTKLTESEQYAFGKRALELKHGEDWFNNHSADVWDFIKPVRPEDVAPTVFNLYNRCQEKLVRGGYKYTSQFEKSIGKLDADYLSGMHKTAKPVKNITVELKLNQDLWQQARVFGEYLQV
jgi:hypothetical protein